MEPLTLDIDSFETEQDGKATAQSTLPNVFARDWRQPLIVLLTILAAAGVLWVAWLVIRPILETIVVFLLSGVVAFALAGPVDAITARLGSRLIVISIIYLLLSALIMASVTVLSGPLISQLSALAADLPDYVRSLETQAPEVEGVLGTYGIPATLEDLKANAANAFQSGAMGFLGGLAVTLAGIGKLLADFVLVLVISFYLLKDGPNLRQRTMSVVPSRHHRTVTFVEENLARVLGGYLRGQLIMAASVGITAGLGCWFLGLPYAVVLGLLAGLFELIPMFGPILSAIPAILVALFMPFPTVVWVALFFLILQQFETNVLAPRITGHAVGLHPLGALFALLAGFQLAGLLGALFAVPLAGFLWVTAVGAYRNAETERRHVGWISTWGRRVRFNRSRSSVH